MEGCDSLAPLLEDFGVAFVEDLQHVVAFLRGCLILEQQRHMRETIVDGVALSIVDVAGHDIPGDVDDAADLQNLLDPVFPVLQDGLLGFLEAVGLSADEETGAVVVVVGSGEGFEVCEVLFDFGELLLGCVGLQLVF